MNAAWMVPACLGLMTRKTPFHLVELGAGTGLRLIADYLKREILYSEEGETLPGPDQYNDLPYPILSRTGIDSARLGCADPLFIKLSQEPSGPKLHHGEPTDMPRMVSSLRPQRNDEGIFIFNFSLTHKLNDEQYEDFKEGMRQTLKPWGDAGFWAELELPRGCGEEPRQLLVHRVIGGELESAALARIDPRTDRFILLKGWNFLQPTVPVRAPRFTFEEPPKQMEPGVYKGPGKV